VPHPEIGVGVAVDCAGPGMGSGGLRYLGLYAHWPDGNRNQDASQHDPTNSIQVEPWDFSAFCSIV